MSLQQRFQSPEARERQRQQAARQLRVSGQFVRNQSNPGTSQAAIRRRARLDSQGTIDDRLRTVREVLNAFLLPGDLRDHVPALVDEGPLVQLIRIIIANAYLPTKRLVFKVTREHYLELRRLKTLPRRDLKRNGHVVKKQAFVFSRYRLPNPRSTTEMSRIKILLSRFMRSGKTGISNIEVGMDAVVSIVGTYDEETKEFSNYPVIPGGLTEQLPATTEPVVSVPSENIFVERPTSTGQGGCTVATDNAVADPLNPDDADDLLYIQRIEATARNTTEYILLKRFLSETVNYMRPCLGQLFVRNVQSSGQVHTLTSIEKAILSYFTETDPAKQEEVRAYLNSFLICCVQLRQAYGLEELQNVGHHPNLEEIRATY